MTRMWSVRLIALGGIALALGCRSHPVAPAISTPLLPGEVTSERPFEPIGPPKPIPPAPPGAQLPKGGIQPPAPFTKLPESKTSDLRLPETGLDGPGIVPPKDVAPMPRSVAEGDEAPQVKPLLVDAPKPQPGPDGFAPAPKIGPPDPTVLVAPPVEPKPALPLSPGQTFGHATDYKWVAGVLDRHVRGGYWTLRYADSGEDDLWGGKVRLLADDRLTAFDSGDMVYLEGDLLAPHTAADSATYPPFRITEIRLVEKHR
jgi:hypothetical protein